MVPAIPLRSKGWIARIQSNTQQQRRANPGSEHAGTLVSSTYALFFFVVRHEMLTFAGLSSA
jgi:hypothetical protein